MSVAQGEREGAPARGPHGSAAQSGRSTVDRDHAGGPPPVHRTDCPDRPRADRTAQGAAAGLGSASKPAGRPWLEAAADGAKAEAHRRSSGAAKSDGARGMGKERKGEGVLTGGGGDDRRRKTREAAKTGDAEERRGIRAEEIPHGGHPCRPESEGRGNSPATRGKRGLGWILATQGGGRERSCGGEASGGGGLAWRRHAAGVRWQAAARAASGASSAEGEADVAGRASDSAGDVGRRERENGGIQNANPAPFERTRGPGDAGRGRRCGEDAWATPRGRGRSGGGGRGGFGGGCRRGAGGRRKGTTSTGGAHLSASWGRGRGGLGRPARRRARAAAGWTGPTAQEEEKEGKEKEKEEKIFPLI
uniref:Uncharacterized protein K0155C03.18 n=1 Tax=Oryza sativa subsp. indica TaxID=39946 RepID=C8TFG2_ORYSI|nr:hypothetical protein [Oryza sativa Indica Group]